MLDALFGSVQSSSVAVAIGQSLTVNALLSSIHLLGITWLVGSVLVSSLRLMGVALLAWPSDDVTRAARGAFWFGLAVTAGSGVLLVSPRILNASGNTFFRLKMLLLFLALVCHVTVFRRALTTVLAGRRAVAVGVAAPTLWLGVVLAGAAFILLE